MFALLLGAQAFATTYVVDDDGGPGVDFTDLPAAVAAAQPGDVLRVMPGSYSAFTCTKAITILGYGGPTVNGQVVLGGILPGRPLVLAGLAPTRLLVTGSEGAVIAQQVAAVDTIRVELCQDVRLLGVNSSGVGSVPGSPGIQIVGSRVEIVQSDVKGVSAADACYTPGGSGVVASTGSVVHFALSNSTGGVGSQCYTQGSQASNGGAGFMAAESNVILAGGGQGRIHGGVPGFAWWWWDNCYYDGQGGFGVRALNADVAYSRVDVSGAPYTFSVSVHDVVCYDAVSPDFYGSAFTSVSPRHSTLALSGIPTPGQAVNLTLSGAVGSHASIWLGRQWLIQSEPNVDIELAVNRLRVIDLGTMPESGSITVPLEISGAYAPGAAFGVQGECRLASGAVRRSNSIPIIVR